MSENNTNDARVEELKEKTVKAISKAVFTVTKAAKDIKDSEQFEKTVDLVKEKGKSALDAASEKYKELKEDEKVKATVANASEKLNQGIDKIKSNESVKSAVGKVSDFMAKPEVTSAVDKAKDTTIDVAEKAVAGLKKLLKSADKESGEEE